MIYAHSTRCDSRQDWEPLQHHLQQVGERARQFAEGFGGGTLARTMGVLHDIGKCSAAYQAYIRRPPDRAGPKGSDHSTAGAQRACALYGADLGRLLGFGIAGHHSGLMNGDGHEGGTLAARLNKRVEPHDGWEEQAGPLPPAGEVRAAVPRLRVNGISKAFSGPFLARMLFSSLVDADFLETEAFYARAEGVSVPARGGAITDAHVRQVRAFLARHRREDSEVNRLRSRILDHANARAALAPGLFTLTVPTGGGKTLTSLSFAMEHAVRHGLRRIVYVIPFTSIVEQTAEIFRTQVGLGDAVLEHHSGFEWDQRAPDGDDSEGEGAEGLAKLRRDAENWDAPVVVTTAVQFFESLFSARTSKARKLHNLAQSVIILDEAQSIPLPVLRPCMAAIEELAANYGASILLCTATQPALRRQDAALFAPGGGVSGGAAYGLDIADERELAPDPAGLYARLRRVRVEYRRDPVRDAEIAARFGEREQMLCIVNSRAHAQALFRRLRAEQPEGAAHLTTLMCVRHRREVLARLRADLERQRPVRLIATSLIEAGVDISFPEVWRAATGLASVAQAAGRCNRGGELGALGEAFGRTVLEADAQPAGDAGITCLITGEQARLARLHPMIKGVEGAQSSGAALVSFNQDAFQSLGKEQGGNAPTGEAAAFRYGTALNHMLRRDGPNRVRRPIGDATVVFWADAAQAEGAAAAENLFGQAIDPPGDAEEAAKIGRDLDALAQGRAVCELRPAITPGTRFHVLGLSPNAARLSVRFWISDDFEAFARHLGDHYRDMHIEPRPRGWTGAPSVNWLLMKTAAAGEKFETIPPSLAGEVMRAVLTGARYPRSWLAAAIMRVRAGDDPLSGWHAAVIRAVLARDCRKKFQKEDVPVSLAPDEPNKAYQLGRLFAVLETAQRLALGKINATIRDRYFGAASATPASVFPLLLRGAQNHLAKLRKEGKGGGLEREIEDILDKLTLDFPRSLPLVEQGRFVLGYYHQRKEQFKGRPEEAEHAEDAEEGAEK